MTMKTLTVSLIALSAFAGTALAQSFDGDNQAPYRPGDSIESSNEVFVPNTLESTDGTTAGGVKWYQGSYGLTTDPDDVRRWSEKND
jgi:hypothetical protein